MKVRVLFLAVAALSIAFSRLNASAGDYEVVYAIDIFGTRETGNTDCTYGKSCRFPLRTEKVRVSVVFDSLKNRWGYVYIRGNGASCCFFSDGADSVHLEPQDSGKRIYRLSIFEGKERKGNEFVKNNQNVGTLYLAFAYLH